MRHILSILIENEAGALSRVVGLFSARAYNIDSLTVSTTEDPTLSRMTIVTHGSDEVIEQITKQLNKLIEVVKVIDLNESEHVERGDEGVELGTGTGQLDHIGRFGDVDDTATENIGHTLHLFAILARRANLDQHQFALVLRSRGEIHHLYDINQLVELLGDLLEHLVGAPGQDGHPRQRRVFGRRHGQRFDVVAAG